MPDDDPISSIRDGTATKALRLIAARGLIPIAPSEMLAILVCLLKDGEPDISSEADLTLSGWTESEICTNLKARDCSPSLLSHFASPEYSSKVLEAVILNPKTPGSAIARLALSVPPMLLELILINRVRVLEFPDILKNIIANPESSPQIRRLVQEIESEFFLKKETLPSIETELAISKSESHAMGIPSSEDVPEDLSLEGLPLDPAEREMAILQRLSKMTPTQKIRYAMFGAREVRSILIRDINKTVARSVLQSPKLTENEIATFAAMRNVSEDILREIGNSRTMTRSYSVIQNLTNNPKTPPQISQRILSRLVTKDIQLVSINRGIPESVRKSAQRALVQRGASGNQR
jgi:hypothetical protein